jgi:hypothetical protein
MFRFRSLVAALSFAACAAHAACPAAARPELALQLLDCLALPDPHLRDEVGFGGLQKLMRGKQLDAATVQLIRVRLLAMLRTPDPAGFAPPFAALTLAEVARVDRIQPFLAPEERAGLVDAAVAYLAGVDDYRGFDEREGWRHGVAHGADLMLQLALNPQLQPAQADAMLAAIARQAVPAGEHFYRYGEGDRLSAPVYFLARRGFLSPAAWEQWLEGIVARLPREPRTQAALAARHNAAGFLGSLYVSTREGGDPGAEQALLPGLRKALRELG